MSAPLDVVDLAGGYSAAQVLHGVDLTLARGEIVGLLGANGAGKTSILRAISGTLPRCRGQLSVAGQSLGGRAPWARVKAGVALVPEGRHVFAAMTVRENLDVAALVGRAAVRRDDVYDLFPRLAERRDQLAGRMSGGEQQMLAIGRALLTGPKVLLIDEMSAGLAPALVHQLVDGLQQLRGGDLAMLLVEQSPHFVAHAVDRVYLLEQGRIVATGSFDELGGVDRLTELYLGLDRVDSVDGLRRAT